MTRPAWHAATHQSGVPSDQSCSIPGSSRRPSPRHCASVTTPEPDASADEAEQTEQAGRERRERRRPQGQARSATRSSSRCCTHSRRGRIAPTLPAQLTAAPSLPCSDRPRLPSPSPTSTRSCIRRAAELA